MTAYTIHGALLERYWLRREQTLFSVRAALLRDFYVARIEVEELEAKAA